MHIHFISIYFNKRQLKIFKKTLLICIRKCKNTFFFKLPIINKLQTAFNA